MSFARIRETFIRLPKQTKFIGIGSIVLAISTLLPWYADLDSYKIGDEFLGVTGPASFVGIVIFLLGGLSFWIFSYRLLERHVPKLPVREGIVHLFVAIESLFLLVLVNSIFFHPKFGVNITLKESRFGMTLAFIGAAILLIGGYLQNREEIESEKGAGKLEPLISLSPSVSAPKTEKPVEPTYQRPHTPIMPPRHAPLLQRNAPEPRKIFPGTKESTRGFLFGEKAAAEPARQVPEKPLPPQTEKKDGKTGDSGSYMIRMDL